MADDPKPLPTRTRTFDLVPLRSTADAGQDLDLLASQYGASDDDEAPSPRRATSGKTLDQLADEFGAYEPPTERRLDERGEVREVDPFGNLVPRAFRSRAPQGPSQKTPGRWSRPKTIDVKRVPQPAFEDTLEGMSRSDIPPAVGDRITDTGVSLLKGAIGIPEAAVGLVDIPAGGRVGKMLDDAGFQPGQAKSILEDWYSDRLKNQKMEVSEADGIMETAVKALSNPDVVFQAVAESLPLMLAGGVAGRFVPGVSSAAWRGSIGEGMAAAGSAEASTRQQSPTGLTTRTQGALAGLTGASTTLLGRLGSGIANKIGLDDIDTLLAAAEFDPIVKTNLVQAIARATVGAGQEGLLEELPQSVVEQWLANAAQGQPLMKGVDEAAVLGAFSGGVMGFAANIQPIRRPGEGDDAAGGDPQRPYGSILGRLTFPEDGGDTLIDTIDVTPAPEPPAPVAPEPPPTSLAALGDENAPAANPPAFSEGDKFGRRDLFKTLAYASAIDFDDIIQNELMGDPELIAEAISELRGYERTAMTRAAESRLGAWLGGNGIDVNALVKAVSETPALSKARASAIGAILDPAEDTPAPETPPAPDVEALLAEADQLDAEADAKAAARRSPVTTPRVFHATTSAVKGDFTPDADGAIFFSDSPDIAGAVYGQADKGLNIEGLTTRLDAMPVEDIARAMRAYRTRSGSRNVDPMLDDAPADPDEAATYRSDVIEAISGLYDENEGPRQEADAILRHFGVENTRTGAAGSNTIPARLSFQNPREIDAQGEMFDAETQRRWIADAKAQGHDGLIIRNYHDGGWEDSAAPGGMTSAGAHTVYVAFDPKQVKSDIGGRPPSIEAPPTKAPSNRELLDDAATRIKDGAVVSDEDAAMLRDLAQEEADANAGAIDTTATNPDEMSDEEMAAEIKRRLEAESAPKAPAVTPMEKVSADYRAPVSDSDREAARFAGETAFRAGHPARVPAKWATKKELGEAWSQAWHAANIAAPVDAPAPKKGKRPPFEKKAGTAPTKTPSDEAMERIAAEDEAERQAEPGWSNTKPTDAQTGGALGGLFGARKPKVGKGGWVIMGRTSVGWGPTSSWSAAKVKADGAKQLDALKAATDARAMRIETPDGTLVYETPAWKTRNAGRISATPTARGYVGAYTDGDGTDWYSNDAFPKVDAAFEAARALAAKRKGPLMHRYTGKRVEYGTEDWNDAANIDKPAKAAPEEEAPAQEAGEEWAPQTIRVTVSQPPQKGQPPRTESVEVDAQVRRGLAVHKRVAPTSDTDDPNRWHVTPVNAGIALMTGFQSEADAMAAAGEVLALGDTDWTQSKSELAKLGSTDLGAKIKAIYKTFIDQYASESETRETPKPVKAKRPPFEKAPPDGWKAEDKVPQKKKAAAPFGKESIAPTYTAIGKNADGQTVYEDGNGVRSLVVEGVRMTESVGMRPTREGMRTFVERDSDGEPKRAEYRVVKAPVLSETPRFKSGNRVTADEGTADIIESRGAAADRYEDGQTIKFNKPDGRVQEGTWVVVGRAGDNLRVRNTTTAVILTDVDARNVHRVTVAKMVPMADSRDVKLTEGEQSALETAGLDEGPDDYPLLSAAWGRGGTLRWAAADTDALVSEITDRANAEDGQHQVDGDQFARRAAVALTNLASKVSKAGRAVDSKRAALDAKRAELKDEIAAAAAAVRAELKKAANTTNSGLPVPDGALILQTVKLVRLYAKAGIVEAAIGWDYFKTDIGADLAAQAKRAFQMAWGMVHKVAEPALEDSDGTTDRGDADGGQLPATGRAAADESGAAREGALGEVPAETDSRSDGERGAGPVDSEARTPDGVRDRGDGSEDGPVASGDRADVPVAALSPAGIGERDPGHAVGDYQLTPERITSIIERGAMERARDNIKAIQIAQDIRAEQRHATAEEQEALAKYVGWGDTNVAKYLAESVDYRWRETEKAVWRQIQGLTTEVERRALVHSTQNAHYTFDLYRPVWAALERAGFTHGRVLEPAVGTGHAFGLMPPGMRQLSTLNAVELEPLTATIAQALYPSARVQASGFEKARLPHGTQDLIISNVPFARGRKSGGSGVRDSRLPEFLTDSIHNYFFAKALTYARPGGLVVFVTTHHTMDAPGAQRVRRHLMSQAHFVGAVRLPNTAFGEGAKTEVVTDIVVLQRKFDDRDEARNADLFIESMKTKNGDRSRWYEEHPELVMGTEDTEGTMYGPGQYNVTAREGDLIEQLAPALEQVLTPGLYEPAKPKEQSAAPTLAEAEETARFGEFSIGDKGQVFRVTQDRKLAPVDVKGETKKRLVGMIGIRDQLVITRRLMRASGDTGIKAAQSKLRKLYDAFAAQHGLLNARVNRALFDGDPEAINLLALEELESKASTVTDKNGKETLKITRELKKLADIFTKRTINAPRAEIKADTPKAALLASLAQFTGINWRYMASISGQTEKALQESLSAEGRVFRQPDGSWVTDDEYLSGDVVSKLEDAEAAQDDALAPNIAALKRAQPVPKKPEEMRIALGSHWVPAGFVHRFMADLLMVQASDLPTPRYVGTREVGRWMVDNLPSHGEVARAAAKHPLTVEFGHDATKTEDKPFGSGHIYTVYDLFSDVLNLKVPYLSWTVKSSDGTSTTYKAPEATLAARGNMEELQAEWEAWLGANPVVLNRLTDAYNERFNRTVERKFDGDHLREYLKDNGLTLPYDLHKHQVDAVWRILATGNTLLAHEVGAGKTLEMIIAAMEMRRTGRARKPMITVPTYLLGPWREAITSAYPDAKVLAFDEKDLDSKKRQQAMARIAFGDWDIVLVPHSSFELLRVSPERMVATLEEMVREIEEAELAAGKGRGRKKKGGSSDDGPDVKALAQMRARIEEKIEKLLKRAEKDNAAKNLHWEDLGVDALLADEAHAFKNLFYFTNMDNIRGLSKSNSDRAIGMYVKTKDLNDVSGGRNLVFATATPVMNSLAEIFTFQRYLQPKQLDQLGLANFDNWYRMYGKAVPRVEQRPDGSYQEVLRVAEFRNLDHLSKVTRSVMDYVGWPDMPYLKLPKLHGDRIDIVQTPKHSLYDKYIQPWFELRLAVLKLFPPRYDRQKQEYIAPDRPDPITGKETGKNDNVLAVMTDARKAAIDIRLVLPTAADSKTSRIQQAADRIFDSYKREAKKKGVQLVFLDWGTPKSPDPLEFLSNVKVEAEVEPDDVDSATPATGEDEDDSEFLGDDDSPVNLYAELRAALVKRGIPSREIAFVHQARNAGERVALFAAAQEGRVRVVVGSTDKGGVGMNIQHRMSDIHELDAPRAMRPGDIRQRHGRGIRQGNVYERIRIHRYVTPGTTDEWQYGLLGAKQDLIEAFMRGTATEFSEPDPTTMSVEEAQARASGDPRAAELIELKGKYGRMKAQAAGALRSVAAAKADAPRLRTAITAKEKNIEKAELFLSEVYQTQRGDGFKVSIGERTFTERKEATAALATVMDSYVARAKKTGSAGDEVIGTIGGIDIVAQWDVPRSWEYDQTPSAAIRLDASKAGEAELTVVAGIDERKAGEDAPFNYALLLVNRYEDLSQTARVLQRELEKLQSELSRAESVLANPPAVIDRATKARARIDELEGALRTESDARTQAAEAGAREAVDRMKNAEANRRAEKAALPAPSGDASAGPAVTMVVSPGKSATLPETAADQMGLTTARPVFVPELVAFLTNSGGKTQVLKKLRSLGARGFFRDGTVTLAADLFKPENAIELARVLAHEIGHLVDWLPDGDMTRGNLLGRLRTMHRFLKHRYTAADGTTVKVKEVRDELLALSKAWRPWPDDAGPKYDAYRRRGRELYADAISALLNDPSIVQQTAPTFFKEFFSELDEKPEVKQAYIELMDVLSGTHAELVDRRRGRARAMIDYGNTKALDLVALKLAERDAMRYSVMDRIRIQHVDRNTALNDRVTDWEKEHGQKVPSHEDPRFLLEEQAHIKGGAKGFAAKYFEPVYRALNKAGVDWTTFGEVLFYERIVAGDRDKVANPQGLSAENAQEMLDAAFASLSAAQRAVAREQADAFRDALREVADRAYQAGLYTDELYKQMQENPAYVTFRVLEYLDQNVTSTVYRQVGTLKDIQHPAEASIVKAMVTLKAAEYNRIKRGTFEWFDANTPGEFATAPTKWMGKQRGWVPQEPKDNKLKLITYKVKGKTVGKHVDPYVAASFERMGADELGVILGTLNLLTSKWLRPVFTTMNPGFMTFNLKRDFDRGWKNMDAALVAQGKPRMTLRRWLKRYYQAVPMSVARAFPSKPGQTVAAWRQRAEQALVDAEEAKILDLTLADILGADNLEDTNIDQVFADIGLSSYAAQKGRLKRFLGWVEAAGDFIETLPKAAAIIELTSDGRTVKELTADERSLIRRKIGSPDYLQRGTKTAASNTIFLFSNAIIQGTRADVEVATDPTTLGGWWFKTAAVNLAPKVMMFALPMAAAALAGGGGDDEDDNWLSFTARVMSGVSEYDKTNYVIVPLGLDENGDSIYARLPQDDTGRLVGGIFWKGLGMMSGDKDAMKSLMQAFDFTAGQLPGSNPLIRAITADLPAMAAGLNIYDPFRSRMLFTPDELAAMDRHTFKKFVGYEFQQLGGGVVWRFVPGEERPVTKSTARTLLDLPVVSNVVGRWLRVGNRGRVEGLRDITSDVRQDEARARNEEKAQVYETIRALQAVPPPNRARVTTERASAIIKDVYPALKGEDANDKRKLVEKKIRLGLVRGQADEYVETIMSSTSPAQKVAVVQRAKREMTPPRFSAWLRRGQDEGVISKAVAEAARKER